MDNTEKIFVEVQQAIELSHISERFPEIDLSVNETGIFGKLKPLDTVLQDRDRVEIYRPLILHITYPPNKVDPFMIGNMKI